MLSLFTIKKILFFGTLGGGILGPIIATSPIVREFAWSSDISPLKEGITNWNLVDIYEGESIPSFFKRVLMYKEGQEGLVESFSQELSKQWYFSQPEIWTSHQREEWKKLQEKQFKDAWEHLKPKNPQRDFWDNYWGSRESMLSFWLRHNSHKLVKSFLTEVDKNDFSLNSSFQKNQEYKNGNLSGLFTNNSSNTDELEKKTTDWEKIGFFPSKSALKLQDNKWEKFIWGKYQFLNWSYRKWFDTNLPTYFWKISWFYDKKSNAKKLEGKYKKDQLKNNFPNKANYFFPIFSEKTNKKFQEFIKKIANDGAPNGGGGGQDLKLEEYFVEGWNGEQASTSTLLDILNSFGNVSPEYASAASYLTSKIFETNGNGAVGGNSPINKLELKKEKEGNGNPKDPTEVFLSENGTGGKDSNNHSISFESEILVESEAQKKKHIYDARETNSNWLFFRDEQGVHALALDGHKYLKQGQPQPASNENNAKDKLFNWFNFRNLQSKGVSKNWSTNKKFLSLTEKEDWFTRFFNYLTSNFDWLLSEYYIKEGDKSLLFDELKNKSYFDNFKDSLSQIFSLRGNDELNSKLFNLRKNIIERYSSRDWTTSGNNGAKEIKVAKEQGLAAPFPYEINLDDKKDGRFPKQEKVFNEFLKQASSASLVAVKGSAPPSPPTYQESEYSKIFATYFQSVNTLIDDKKIDLKIRSDGFDFQNSQRLFVVDSIFDYLLDKLFANKGLLNHRVKEKRLLEGSLFSGNGLLQESKGTSEEKLPWVAPINYENKINEILKTGFTLTAGGGAPPATTSTAWECKGVMFDQEKIKENLRSLLNSLLKSYFFRTYLRGLKDNYFGFLADYPEGKPKTTQDGVQVSGGTTRFSFLVNDLFEKWRQSYLADVRERDKFLDFLISLNFLTKKNFEKLKEILRGDMSSNTKYHYLFFESVSGNEEQKKQEQQSHTDGIHPFLSNGKKEDNKKISFENRSKARTYIRENWKPKGELKNMNGGSSSSGAESSAPGGKNEAMFKELLIEQTGLPNKKENLFNFKDLRGLLTAINNTTNYSDFEKIVSLLSKISGTNVNVDFYRSDKIYITNSKEKKIYLEEKKKLLIYQLLHTDKNNFYSSNTFETSVENDIFKQTFEKFVGELTTTPTVVSVSAPANGNVKNHLKADHFKRGMEKTEGGYFIQVSYQDFESDVSLCAFFNLLPMELLSEFIMDQADKPLNKEKAQSDFFEAIRKLKPRDMKFKNHIDSKYVE